MSFRLLQHFYACCGHSDCLETINAKYHVGCTPQHFSACWGHRDCLEILAESGLQLDCSNKAGESPKDLAMRYNHQNCVEFIDSTGGRK